MRRREFLRRTGGVFFGASAFIAPGGPELPPGRSPSELGATSRPPDDLLIVNGSDVSSLTAEYLDWLEETGVTVWAYNGLGKVQGALGGLRYFDQVHDFLDAHSDRVSLATSVRQIRRAREDGRIAMMLGWQSADPFRDEPDGWQRQPPKPHIRSFHKLGLRMCGITYNLANMFGGGCLDPNVGLTRAGRHLVEQLHSFGIIIDIGGHTGERTSMDIVEMSAGVPLVCSHSNSAALVDNPRNISDRLIEAIASTGGVVGITAINDFNARSAAEAGIPSTPQVSVEAMLDHVEHVRRLVGVEHVALGPDFTSLRPPLPQWMRPGSSLVLSPEMASVQNPIRYVDGFEEIRQLPNVVRRLRARGWTDRDLRALLQDNWLRVYERVWGG